MTLFFFFIFICLSIASIILKDCRLNLALNKYWRARDFYCDRTLYPSTIKMEVVICHSSPSSATIIKLLVRKCIPQLRKFLLLSSQMSHYYPSWHGNKPSFHIVLMRLRQTKKPINVEQSFNMQTTAKKVPEDRSIAHSDKKERIQPLPRSSEKQRRMGARRSRALKLHRAQWDKQVVTGGHKEHRERMRM